MNGLRNSNLQDNEIVKATDVQLIGDGGIENLGKAIKTLFGSSKSVVIGGKLTPHTVGSALAAKMSPIMGVGAGNENLFIDHEGKFYNEGDTEPSEIITFVAADSSSRRDIVEIKAGEITAAEQTRQFYDPETESYSYSQTDTEKRNILILKVKKGTAGSDSAPTVDEGFVKLAEVVIPGNAITLEAGNIFNITADIEGVDNNGWTNEKQVTINPGTIKDITAKFRAIHNSDGSLKDDVIAASKIILSGSGALRGSGIQKGGFNVSIGGVSYGPTTDMSTITEKIVGAVGSANGIASLSSEGKLPDSQLSNAAVQSINGVVPSDGNVNNVIPITEAEYNSLSPAEKKGKFFLVSNTTPMGYSELRDDVVATDSTWSSSKISSNLNSALANLTELLLITSTDANDCIPTNKKYARYMAIGSNLPTSAMYLLDVTYEKSASINQDRITQIAYLTSGNTTNKPTQYMRYGVSTNNGSTWTWGNWEKLTTETDLNNALTDYTKIVKVNVSDTSLDALKTALLNNISTLNNGDIIHIYRDTQKRAVLILNKQSDIYFDVTISSFYYTENELRYNNGTWQDSFVLNTILANLDTLYLSSMTDANECVLTNRGVKSWRVYGSNTPTSATYFITSYYTSEAQKRITQIAYLASANVNTIPIQYIRYGVSTDNINWTWGNWYKSNYTSL